MAFQAPSRSIWLALALAAGAAGSAWLVSAEVARQEAAFEVDARIAHRLLSQRVVQQDAILATLNLLQPGAAQSGGPGDSPERRLPALYPQVLEVQRRGPGQPWPAAPGAASNAASGAAPGAELSAAEQASARLGRAVLAQPELASGHYTLVRAGQPASHALRIDAQAMVPWDEWPLRREGPVRVTLGLPPGPPLVLQAGAAPAAGWHFRFDKVLASESQPFHVTLSATLPWQQAPWGRLAVWWLAVAAVAGTAAAALRQRAARRRAEELLRLGQVGRLNAMGELAAGMAHELNQPLTAVLASTQAAQRLLAEEPADLETARQALERSVQQARRAGEVVSRLRRLVQPPEAGRPPQALPLAQAVRNVLQLLAPEAERLGLHPELQVAEPGAVALADPVALDQIIHNLVQNALQALAATPAGSRRLRLVVDQADARSARLRVVDSGGGFSAEALARAFEPFFTTRTGGLGLGLSLCETLAAGMGGTLTARHAEGGGAELTLLLPSP